MRVICINTKPMQNASNLHLNLISENDVYTVAGRTIHGGYFLSEVNIYNKYGQKIGYHQDRFIPCSDIDETEMVRESNLIKI